jgi:hypothetical protein
MTDDRAAAAVALVLAAHAAGTDVAGWLAAVLATAAAQLGSSYPECLPACHCWENARRMAALHPELRYVEGHLVIPRADGLEPYLLEHAWCVAPDGAIIDATAWAYDDFQPLQYQPARRLAPP